MNREYISAIIRKTNRLSSAYRVLLNNPPESIKYGAIALLEKSEKELNEFDRDSDLEKRIARDVIFVELQGVQGDILEKNSCSSCSVLQAEIEKKDEGLLFEEYPLCAKIRIQVPTKNCPEYQQIHNLQSQFRDMDRDKFASLN